MLLRLTEIRLSLEDDQSLLVEKAARLLGVSPCAVTNLHVVRKSLDARKKGKVSFVYTVHVEVGDDAVSAARIDGRRVRVVTEEPPPSFSRLANPVRPVIVGTGPAGLFAALRLTEYGLSPLILERGREIGRRVRDVELFWRRGILDPESNVQFGEGGAGTFSDGKLTTRVDDRRMSYILRAFVDAGADPEILYLAKPHIGTDRLRSIIVNLRHRLLDKGCEIRFGAKVTGFNIRRGKIISVVVNGSEEVPAGILILATGHSARDTYEALHEAGVEMAAKPFAVGFRVEHPQELIDSIQYGRSAGHPALPPSEYFISHNMKDKGRSVYSFCMCPGGMIIAASSEPGGLVVNGMSMSGRDSGYANSALIVTVAGDDFGGHSLSGIEFQRRWEEAAFREGGGGYRAPAQNLLEFVNPKSRQPLVGSTCRPGLTRADLGRCLPGYVVSALREALPVFDRKMKGFVTAEATLVGVETRTSAPVRVVRGRDFQAAGVEGLYPCGEGSGYAGGIMSSALDGIRVADSIASGLSSRFRAVVPDVVSRRGG